MKLKTIGRVIALSFKNTPFSSAIMILYYLLNAAFPSVFLVVNAFIFDNVSLFLQEGTGLKNVSIGIFILIAIFIFQQLSEVFCNLVINIGVYEKNISCSRFRIFEKCAELPLIYYEDGEFNNGKDKALNCVNYEKLSQLFMSVVVLVTKILSVVSVLVILAQYSVWFILLSVASILPYFVIRIIRGKEFYYMKHKQVKKVRKLNYLWSLFVNPVTAKEMRVFDFGNHVKNHWMQLHNEVNEETWKQNRKDAFSLLFCDFIKILGYGICIVATFFMVLEGQISIGIFSSCLIAFSNMQEETKGFLIELAFLPEMLLYAEDYFHFLDLPVTKEDNFDTCKEFQDEIVLRDVSFAYPNQDKNALDAVNLKIKKGTKIVVLGENGSGKTTLCKILLGIYQHNSGYMEVDGHDFANMKKRDWHSLISIVNQDFTKYQLTLRENVAISDTSKLHEDALIAKQLSVNDLDELMVVPEGLDRQLGTAFGGVDLSGGQWQNVAIARGFFRQSEIVLLDEPTSALDAITENKVLTRFKELSEGKTAIIISHRVGLSKFSDVIIVMKNGKVHEIGNHKELMEKNGEYKRLFTAQSKWYS